MVNKIKKSISYQSNDGNDHSEDEHHMSGPTKDVAGGDNHKFVKIFPFNKPPQPILSAIHPLINLKHTEDERTMARMEAIQKKILSKAAELDSIYCWNELAEKKKFLQELFTTAEKGIKENRASMARFYEIIKDNEKHKVTLEIELEFTQQRIEEFREIEQELEHYVDKYSIFEKFLENVAGVDDSARNVRDILDRYETLQSTSIECARILQNELEQAAELRKRMLVLIEEKSSKLKHLSNRLILQEVHRKDARERRVYWEHMMQRIKYTALDKMQEAISLREGINDLYRSMCLRLRVVPGLPPEDIQGQINFIHKSIMFYKEVVTIAMGMKIPQGQAVMERRRTKTKKQRVK